ADRADGYGTRDRARGGANEACSGGGSVPAREIPDGRSTGAAPERDRRDERPEDPVPAEPLWPPPKRRSDQTCPAPGHRVVPPPSAGDTPAPRSDRARGGATEACSGGGSVPAREIPDGRSTGAAPERDRRDERPEDPVPAEPLWPPPKRRSDQTCPAPGHRVVPPPSAGDTPAP